MHNALERINTASYKTSASMKFSATVSSLFKHAKIKKAS
ncbi:hypothetical protein EVA_22224 [gut metagenome]|uniref:Uncharacterized protein n=1 Tax=gut metagenome TaxID=749906 RepID=J9FJ65_9ZZZZ